MMFVLANPSLAPKEGQIVSLTPEDIRAIVTAFESSDWSELSLQHGDTRLEMSRTGAPTLASAPPTPAVAPAPTATAPTASAAPSAMVIPPVVPAPSGPTSVPDGVPVLAPTVGLFWCSPQPGAPPFVQVGQHVEADDQVCIVEVMKLMSHVKAGIAGVVVALPVANGAMVEHGDTLLVIAPED